MFGAGSTGDWGAGLTAIPIAPSDGTGQAAPRLEERFARVAKWLQVCVGGCPAEVTLMQP